MNNILKIMLLSAVPIIEQRGAIPLGIIYNINPVTVFIVCLIGSLVPVPFILLLFNKMYDWMKNYRIFDKPIGFIEKKINKNSAKMQKYKEIGLILFIAIPLPTTGVWTGSVVAAFLRLDFKKSLICAAIGASISAFVLTLASVVPTLF